jgi:hypothetical protein
MRSATLAPVAHALPVQWLVARFVCGPLGETSGSMEALRKTVWAARQMLDAFAQRIATSAATANARPAPISTLAPPSALTASQTLQRSMAIVPAPPPSGMRRRTSASDVETAVRLAQDLIRRIRHVRRVRWGIFCTRTRQPAFRFVRRNLWRVRRIAPERRMGQ